MRSCADSFYANRTRPCLLYQIKRCSAPCTGEIGEAEYAGLVAEARAFLSGKSRAVRDRLAEEMAAASAAMEFERAARLRDRIAALSAIQGAQGINPKTVEEADVFAIVEQAGQFCVEVFFFRTYQNWGNRAYFPRADKSLAPDEVLDSFLAQFYADKPPPRLILLSHEIENRGVLEEALRERSGHKIEIAVPRKGEKRDLVEQAGKMPARPWDANCPRPPRRQNSSPRLARLRPRPPATPDRGLRQLPYHGNERGRRDDRGGRGRLHENALSHV